MNRTRTATVNYGRRLHEASLARAFARVNVRGIGAMALAATLGCALLALLTRPLLGHPPLYDELLHVFAARGLLTTGEPAIGEGLYDRAELFSWLVAAAFHNFGDSMVAARLPAWLAALALVAVTGAWVVRRAGLVAGISAALLLAVKIGRAHV